MNIHSLQAFLSRTEEIFVIGKNKEVSGVICNVMGVVRDGPKIRLLVLQYDEAFQQKAEEAEISHLEDTFHQPESNRMVMRGMRIEAANPFQSVSKVMIGAEEFEVNSCQNQQLNLQDWQSVLMLTEFLRKGWQPRGIDFQKIDMLFLTTLELQGEYSSIPAFDENPTLCFAVGPNSVTYPVEKPVSLTVGGEYSDKLVFQNLTTGEAHWVQINRVYLLDVWEEVEKTFNDPRVQEQVTPEQLAQSRSDLEKNLLEICPKGMCLPAIEYECQDDISLQFYSKEYLDAKPVGESRSIGFIVRPEQPKGILGYKLKTAVIQEPVMAETTGIEAELFEYHHTVTGEDIIL